MYRSYLNRIIMVDVRVKGDDDVIDSDDAGDDNDDKIAYRNRTVVHSCPT